MSNLVRFQPEMLTTAGAPARSAEFQVTVRVCDSPGNSVMSLFCQSADWSSLSPDASPPLPLPRRMSARSRKATELELFVIVTVVDLSLPFGPGAVVVVVEVAAIEDGAIAGSVCSPVRFAYVETVPCGEPSVLLQSTTSVCVDSQ